MTELTKEIKLAKEILSKIDDRFPDLFDTNYAQALSAKERFQLWQLIMMMSACTENFMWVLGVLRPDGTHNPKNMPSAYAAYGQDGEDISG